MDISFRSGYVALAGRPNVGKSTLLNALVREPLAIVTNRPQTTRDRILGIRTENDTQMIFLDTPGMHRPKTRLGDYMVLTAREAYRDADVLLFLVEPGRPGPGDRFLLEVLEEVDRPIILVINKADLADDETLLGTIDRYKDIFRFREIIPVSALKERNLDRLLSLISALLPEGPRYYPEDAVTDRAERFLAGEIIREQVMERTRDEVPFSIAVEITEFEERADGSARIQAVVFVERDTQKGIIIGNRGARIKSVGIAARKKIAELRQAPVDLGLRVKVRKDWRNQVRSLRGFGYAREPSRR